MKESRFLIFLLLFALASVYLTGEFWIKHLDAGEQQIIYEPRSGAFLSLKPEYTIFDISGTIYRKGVFKRGNREWIQLQNTISLDDGSFFSLAYSYDENNQIIGYYKIIGFSWFGDVHFVKGVRVNTQLFQLRHLLQVGDKIKLLGYEDPGNLIGNLVILNFTEEGDLLDFRRFGINIKEGRFYSSDIGIIKTDTNHYVIIKTGEIRIGNNLFKGIYIMKLTVDDELVMIKSYYNPDIWGGYFETPVIKEDLEKGYILLMMERRHDNGKITRVPHLFKFDEDWQMKWSKKYQAGTPLSWARGVYLLPGQDSYTIGLSKSVTINDEALSNPVLIKIDKNGIITWSRKYEYAGPHGILEILYLNNGGMLMTAHNQYFYMLDGSGKVPGGCAATQEISIEISEFEFSEELVDTSRVTTSLIPASTTDYRGFFDEYDITGNGDEETFCEYLTLQGEFDSVIERSRFTGYYVHRVRFSVDPAIAPYISKFHVYRKFSDSPGDYEFVTEIEKIENQTDYEVEFRPFVSGKSAYNYKVTAYNQKDELVDYAFLK